MNNLNRVFISYSTKDIRIARDLADYLEARGLQCWYAPRNIQPGDIYCGNIVRAIKDAGIFILIFSSYSNCSRHVLTEVHHAFNSGCLIIPFKISNENALKSLDHYIRMAQWLDATTPPMQDRYLDLYHAIEERIQNSNNEASREQAREGRPNMLMSDPARYDKYGNASRAARAFGSNLIQRRKVRSITFLSSLKDATGEIWDVSALKDESVLAWYAKGIDQSEEYYDLFIGAEGRIYAPYDCSGMFHGYLNLRSIHFNECFDTSNTISMHAMFRECIILEELDVGQLITDQVADMSEMFCECRNLRELDVSRFETECVEDMRDMFHSCHRLRLLDVGGFDTSLVNNMSGMFMGCTDLIELDVSGFETDCVTDMSYMFQDCWKLPKLDVSNFSTGNVNDMQGMFGQCSEVNDLEVGGFNTSEVTDMNEMFMNCHSLKRLDVGSFDTSKVTDMQRMFYECESLLKLNVRNFDTGNVASMEDMFAGCINLYYLDVRNFIIRNKDNTIGMFDDCENLPEEMRKIPGM